MNIETKWLKDIIVLEQTRNFSQAALLRHVTQPAFSRRIQALEKQLGYKLVNRLKHPLEFTTQGEVFVRTANSMLDTLSSGLEQMAERDLRDKLLVNFSCTHTLSMGIFPSVLEYMNKLPYQVETHLKVADADDCISLLSSNLCDYLLAFSDPKLNKYKLNSILIGSELTYSLIC